MNRINNVIFYPKVAIERGYPVKLRVAVSSDFRSISPLLNDWWGGRPMVDMLPKLFFQHFSSTSLVMEQDGEIIGFLVGVLSQDHVEEAYIHFVGVHPNH